jgi:hypothetical protein
MVETSRAELARPFGELEKAARLAPGSPSQRV